MYVCINKNENMGNMSPGLVVCVGTTMPCSYTYTYVMPCSSTYTLVMACCYTYTYVMPCCRREAVAAE